MRGVEGYGIYMKIMAIKLALMRRSAMDRLMESVLRQGNHAVTSGSSFVVRL
jgi:hypothetical protein